MGCQRSNNSRDLLFPRGWVSFVGISKFRVINVQNQAQERGVLYSLARTRPDKSHGPIRCKESHPCWAGDHSYWIPRGARVGLWGPSGARGVIDFLSLPAWGHALKYRVPQSHIASITDSRVLPASDNE